MAKVLVVDDVEDNIKLLRYDLEDDGYEVEVAYDGEEALTLAAEQLPDVILLDIMMPKMDGIEACQHLKADPRLSHIPVIMLSAKGQDEDVIRGLDVGATDYISKPIRYPIVAARVRSAVRAKELNEQLREEKERVEAALRARNAFFATMSHEIRTPITAVMGLAEIIAGDDDASPFDNGQAARMVLSNSRYLLEVINNILDLSKAESGKLEIEQIKCSLFEVMRDVESIVELKAVEKELLFLVDYAYPLPKFIHSDPTRLKQVLINFVSNAIKFTDTGSVRVKVNYLKDTNELELSVLDSGIGMTPEEQKQLFQPYQQANETITRRFGGTGLGLSISKTIVDMFGGGIEVESVKGEGTTFRIRIPSGVTSDVEFVQQNPLLNMESLSANPHHFTGKVLVVEDEPINQKLIAHILKRTGLEVEVAGCGESGVEQALGGGFDLVFMDLHLPKLDGLSAIKLLKSKNLKTPLVALTASQDRQEIEALMNAGCDEYVPKPFERAQLYQCLKRYFTEDAISLSEAAARAVSESALTNDAQYAELILQYLRKLHARLSDLEESFSSNDWDGLREKAHRLAGAGLFGFPKISLVSKLLEEQALRKDHQTCTELLKRLRQEIKGITADNENANVNAQGADKIGVGEMNP